MVAGTNVSTMGLAQSTRVTTSVIMMFMVAVVVLPMLVDEAEGAEGAPEEILPGVVTTAVAGQTVV